MSKELLDVTVLTGQTILCPGIIFETEKKSFYLNLLFNCLKTEAKWKVHLFAVLCAMQSNMIFHC